MRIQQIIDKIDENQLHVPAFQREYVWKKDNAKQIISSLIKGYPTWTMLTRETNTPPELKWKHKYNPMQWAIKLVLDGQQRITTLYMMITGNIPPYYHEDDIKHDPRGLHVNLETLELEYYMKNKMENNPLWVDVTDIFQKRIKVKDVIRALKEKQEVDDALDDLIDDNFEKVKLIPEKEFLEQTVPVKASINEAINIFYIVNASGVNLTDAELALAQISWYRPNIRALLKEKLAELAKEWFVFKLDFLIYVLLGVLYTMGSDMTKLHSSDNEEKIKEARHKLSTESLDYMVNIMRTHAHISHTKEINSVYALVPIIVYIYNHGKSLSTSEINKIIKRFYYSQIRYRYISQLPQKLDKDLNTVARSQNPFDELLNAIKLERPLEIIEEEFIWADVRNPLFWLMRRYFKSKGAVCLTEGVDISKTMWKKYTLEYDHIFPYSVLKKNWYNMNDRAKYALAQEITNRAILTQIANRSKSDMEAFNFLTNAKSLHPNALTLQCIPSNEELRKLENFELFLQERRRMLTKELNQFLDTLTKTEDISGPIFIEDIIAAGESNEIEFKSSLRRDIKENIVNKKLEDVVMKVISSFANTEWGTLLIWVNDEGEILWLEADYESLDGDKDEFELHLRNLIKDRFGGDFSAQCISISFHNIDDMEICKIEIQPSYKELYLETTDKNWQKSWKFFVRDGNASKDLVAEELSNYIKKRFK
jgi:uncharacterized protein with ParB-like and HNH nuclease domain